MNTPQQCPVWLQVEKPVCQAFRSSMDILTCCQVMTEFGFFRKLRLRRDNSFFCHSRTGISALFLAILSHISSTIRILSGRGNVSMFLHDVVMLKISQKKWPKSTGFHCLVAKLVCRSLARRQISPGCSPWWSNTSEPLISAKRG